MSLDKCLILDDEFNLVPCTDKKGSVTCDLTQHDLSVCKQLTQQLRPTVDVVVFKSTNPTVKECIVALETEQMSDENNDLVLVIKHWNYHPRRQGLQHTHTTSKVVTSLAFRVVDMYLVGQVKATFNSLQRLLS